jgi:hypothetical protein
MKDHRPPPARRWQSHLLGLREFPAELAEALRAPLQFDN